MTLNFRNTIIVSDYDGGWNLSIMIEEEVLNKRDFENGKGSKIARYAFKTILKGVDFEWSWQEVANELCRNILVCDNGSMSKYYFQ